MYNCAKNTLEKLGTTSVTVYNGAKHTLEKVGYTSVTVYNWAKHTREGWQHQCQFVHMSQSNT